MTLHRNDVPSPNDGATPEEVCDKHCNTVKFLMRLVVLLALRRKRRIPPHAKLKWFKGWLLLLCHCLFVPAVICTYDVSGQYDQSGASEQNLEQSVAAVFNKVAYGSTTKRSIPDSVPYPVTTFSTPLLTTYRYTDGNANWMRVDVPKDNRGRDDSDDDSSGGVGSDFSNGYGLDLEKDHALPTSAPAADILKNNNNKHYHNPNRYNNDRQRSPTSEFDTNPNDYRVTTPRPGFNVRPTKSMYNRYHPPNYVPPSRSPFTPPIPRRLQIPFADKPTMRGTNSDNYHNRRPVPPPSLTPKKDMIPFRPDLLNTKSGNEPPAPPHQPPVTRKKTLNTPSASSNHNSAANHPYGGLGRSNSTHQFEYDKNYAPEASITRILSGSNGRNDDMHFPEILYSVTSSPQHHTRYESISKFPKSRTPEPPAPPYIDLDVDANNDDDPGGAENDSSNNNADEDVEAEIEEEEEEEIEQATPNARSPMDAGQSLAIATTPFSDLINLPAIKAKDVISAGTGHSANGLNVSLKVNSEDIWLVCWNVHVYLVVVMYTLLACFSIYKLIRYENDPHMFSKSYFLTIHLMLTVICVLRIFYLTYDPYNAGHSFNVFLYDFLHNFPLSLLATTFAVLIMFLLKRTLTHLEVKTRPVFLVVFALIHIGLCLTLSTFESFGHLDKASLIICRPVFVLLAWALGFSYLYLYRIIKNVLAKKSQHLSEMSTQNISYASHITIAVALLFVLLGMVQLYSLFFIKVDRFNGEIKYHWILWGYELSVRVLELSIVTLLAVVVSLRMSQREKQCSAGGSGIGGAGGGGGGFPLFPCTTSDSSTDNIYPTNCNTNPNATMTYSRNELCMDNLSQSADSSSQPSSNAHGSNAVDLKKSATLERFQAGGDSGRFDRSKWSNGSNLGSFDRSSRRKYYVKPSFEDNHHNDDEYHQQQEVTAESDHEHNIYSEPIDHNQHHYERTRHDFERELEPGSRRSSRSSIQQQQHQQQMRRSSTGRRKHHHQYHQNYYGKGGATMGGAGGGAGGGGVIVSGGLSTAAGVHHTLPPNHHDLRHLVESGGGSSSSPIDQSMLVDEQGFVRFRHLQEGGDQLGVHGLNNYHHNHEGSMQHNHHHHHNHHNTSSRRLKKHDLGAHHGVHHGSSGLPNMVNMFGDE